MSNPNAELIRQLEVLLERARNGKDKNDPFRVKSYKSAIAKISGLPNKLSSIDDIPLTKTSKIFAKVREFIQTGRIAEVDDVLDTSKELLACYELFQKITEVGPVKARVLVDEHGMKTIEDLRANQHLLNDKQQIGLRYFEYDQMRIPRKEIDKHIAMYAAIIRGNFPDLQYSINGSYRRGAKDSGDIDILVTTGDGNPGIFREFVDYLIQSGYLIDHLAYGDKKYMGYGRLFNKTAKPRRIDVIYTPPAEYPFAQLYFTGSGPFNVKMRDLCAKRGLRLNEKALLDLKTGKSVEHQFRTERDIFDYLGLDWVEPTARLETYEF